MLGFSGTLDNPFDPPRPRLPESADRDELRDEEDGHGLRAPRASSGACAAGDLEPTASGTGQCNFCGGCIFGCLHAAISNMSETYLPDAESNGARILEHCMATRVRLKPDGKRLTVSSFSTPTARSTFRKPARWRSAATPSRPRDCC